MKEIKNQKSGKRIQNLKVKGGIKREKKKMARKRERKKKGKNKGKNRKRKLKLHLYFAMGEFSKTF